ncbi:DUF262 domain-containing protein [Haloterrigena sp. SYSU A558-1]|uniref:DUF262 domain-containing protein n=1 Tax=Haloterrigena gelatinilytica TaxID=2741724 RepID=A0ABX2LLU6_9EURY|nr:DUF262 domain-containing protein [Haloterrigena gelatinilytica]NUC74766.1 DUF262 domain-containing protein [Haloterrigena gelatinilytica]
MESSDETPLCGTRVFLYPGDPDGTGIIDYDPTDYREIYQDLDFVDSTQFIRSLEQDIELKNRSLLRVTDGERFEVPEYQRNFSWEEEQHEELWDTLLSILTLKPKSGELPVDTYFGTVYIARSSQGEVYEIIDGQQRLSTVSILLKNIKDHLEEKRDQVDGQLQEYAEHICEEYLDELLYRRKGPTETPFLELNDHDDKIYELLFQDPEKKVQTLKAMDQYDGRKQNAIRLRDLFDEIGIPEEVYEDDEELADTDLLESFRYFGDSHRRLVQTDEYYDAKVAAFADREEFDTPEKEVKALLNLAHFTLRSLRVSECIFQTDNQELRIEVFQSLNDRGVELSNMDKVRARIVGRFQGESDSDKQIARWENVVQMFGGDADAVEDFLAHYLAATEKSFETVTDARSNMLEAFRLKQIGRRDIKSRLASPGQARDFLEELENYAGRYREIVTADLTDDDTELKKEYREECEAILQRLNKLGTKQWRPFVMYVYQAVTEAPGKDAFLRDILKTVENITFRVAISDLVATVVDDTYPKTCQAFRELEQSGNQFDVDTISETLIENIDSSARQLFDESFIDVLITSENWRNNQTKQLFLKLADEDFRRRNQTGITKSELSEDPSEVHIEHILPLSYFLPGKENPYAWLECFFDNGDRNMIETQIDYLRNRDAHLLSADDPGYDEIEQIIDGIEERFVRDLGNMMLLDEEVNTPIKNRLFSVKLREYHLRHSKDMDNLVNQYFSTTDNISNDKLEELVAQDLPEDETQFSEVHPTVQYFNEWWTYEQLVDRKAQLITAILESLKFRTEPDEFEPYMDDIEDYVKEDIEKRLAVLTA